jgi:hypothetical protein
MKLNIKHEMRGKMNNYVELSLYCHGRVDVYRRTVHTIVSN